MQSAQRAHLLRHWEAGPSPFSQHTGLCAALRATAFVPVGAERRLCTPAEVLDPRDGLLSYVFGGEPVFPESECASEAWLSLLTALGMKTRVDAEAFVRCARKVEALGAATQGAPPTADVLARAALLTAHLHDNFLTLCSGTEEGGGLALGPTTAFADADAFCGALRGVRFVPSHAASALAGPHEGEPVLACFGELALHQDRRLLWTVAPVLRRANPAPHPNPSPNPTSNPTPNPNPNPTPTPTPTPNPTPNP